MIEISISNEREKREEEKEKERRRKESKTIEIHYETLGVEKLDEFLEFHNSGAKFLILFYKISLGCMFCPKMSYVTNIHMI